MKLTARKSVTGFLLVLPMMLGFLALYAVPFAMVVANSATQGIASNLRWVGLENIHRLLHNGLFRLAFANTAKFLLVGIPLLLVVAYSIALVVKKYAFQFRVIRSVLLMPYIMPLVGSVVLVDAVFSPAGGLAELAQALGLPAADWFHSDLAFWVVVLLFLWKSTGYGVILLLSGLATIDEAQYDAAELDGANAWMQLRYITVPQMWYSVYFTAVFSLINAFKCFREVFLLGGNHPNDSIYMLQHFINNTFQNLNYPKLASASIVLFVVMSAVFALLYRWVLKKEEMLG